MEPAVLVVGSAVLESAAVTFRFMLAFVFLAAALPKLVGRREFEQAVRNYRVVPSSLVPVVAAWLPRLELACAVALFGGIFLRPVAVALSVLLVCFAGAVAVNLARGRRFDCGCQVSVAPRQIDWGVVVVDLALAGLAATVAVAAPRVFAVDAFRAGESQSITTGDAVALLFVAGALFLVYQLLEAVIAARGTAASAHLMESSGR